MDTVFPTSVPFLLFGSASTNHGFLGNSHHKTPSEMIGNPNPYIAPTRVQDSPVLFPFSKSVSFLPHQGTAVLIPQEDGLPPKIDMSRSREWLFVLKENNPILHTREPRRLILNRFGLTNDGLKNHLKRLIRFRSPDRPMGLSLFFKPEDLVDDFANVKAMLELILCYMREYSFLKKIIRAITINVSCPSVKNSQLLPKDLWQILSILHAAGLPIFVTVGLATAPEVILAAVGHPAACGIIVCNCTPLGLVEAAVPEVAEKTGPILWNNIFGNHLNHLPFETGGVSWSGFLDFHMQLGTWIRSLTRQLNRLSFLILVGGGVASYYDLVKIADAGFDGALLGETLRLHPKFPALTGRMIHLGAWRFRNPHFEKYTSVEHL